MTLQELFDPIRSIDSTERVEEVSGIVFSIEGDMESLTVHQIETDILPMAKDPDLSRTIQSHPAGLDEGGRPTLETEACMSQVLGGREN